MSSVYEQFLDRHRATLEAALGDIVAKTTPVLKPDEVQPYTERVTKLLISLALAQPLPEINDISAESRRRGVSPEKARERGVVFLQTLQQVCETDPKLTDVQRLHIKRMLESSYQYMQSYSIVLIGQQKEST